MDIFKNAETHKIHVCLRCEKPTVFNKVPMDFNGEQIGYLCDKCDKDCYIDGNPTEELKKFKEKIIITDDDIGDKMNDTEKLVRSYAIDFSVNKTMEWDTCIYKTMQAVGCSRNRALELLGIVIKELHE